MPSFSRKKKEELSAAQEEALKLTALSGTRPRDGGYVWINTAEDVDMRTIRSLIKRGLVDWGTPGAAVSLLYSDLYLTKEGEQLVEELYGIEV